MKSRQWKRGKRRYDFGSKGVQAIVFGATGATLWAWAVWGANDFRAEGVEFSLRSAKRKANENLDSLAGKEKQPQP